MRVFSQINNCQQKQNKKHTKKTEKTKRGAPLLGLAKSIYYSLPRQDVIMSILDVIGI